MTTKMSEEIIAEVLTRFKKICRQRGLTPNFLVTAAFIDAMEETAKPRKNRGTVYGSPIDGAEQ